MTIPKINRTNEVSVDGPRGRRECLARTIEHRADENSGKSGLLPKIKIVWDLWGVGVIGPRLFRRVRHGSDVDEPGGGSVVGGVEGWKEGLRVKKDLEVRWRNKGLGL